MNATDAERLPSADDQRTLPSIAPQSLLSMPPGGTRPEETKQRNNTQNTNISSHLSTTMRLIQNSHLKLDESVPKPTISSGTQQKIKSDDINNIQDPKKERPIQDGIPRTQRLVDPKEDIDSRRSGPIAQALVDARHTTKSTTSSTTSSTLSTSSSTSPSTPQSSSTSQSTSTTSTIQSSTPPGSKSSTIATTSHPTSSTAIQTSPAKTSTTSTTRRPAPPQNPENKLKIAFPDSGEEDDNGNSPNHKVENVRSISKPESSPDKSNVSPIAEDIHVGDRDDIPEPKAAKVVDQSPSSDDSKLKPVRSPTTKSSTTQSSTTQSSTTKPSTTQSSTTKSSTTRHSTTPSTSTAQSSTTSSPAPSSRIPDVTSSSDIRVVNLTLVDVPGLVTQPQFGSHGSNSTMSVMAVVPVGPSMKSGSTNAAAIVVPTLFGVVILAAMVAFLILYRRRRQQGKGFRYRRKSAGRESSRPESGDIEKPLMNTTSAPVYALVDKSKIKKRLESSSSENIPLSETTPNGHVINQRNSYIEDSKLGLNNNKEKEETVFVENELYEDTEELYSPVAGEESPAEEETYEIPEDVTGLKEENKVIPELPKRRRTPPPIPADPPLLVPRVVPRVSTAASPSLPTDPPLLTPRAAPPSTPAGPPVLVPRVVPRQSGASAPPDGSDPPLMAPRVAPRVSQAAPPPVPVAMPLSVDGSDSSSESDFEVLPEELQGATGGGPEPEYYVSPLCHDHRRLGRDWKPFHEYDPVYIPHSDPQGMAKMVDSTNYVRGGGRHRSDSRVTNPYEEIQFGDIYATVDEVLAEGAGCVVCNHGARASATPVAVDANEVTVEIDPMASLFGAMSGRNPWHCEPRYSGLLTTDSEDTLDEEQHEYTALDFTEQKRLKNSRKKRHSEKSDENEISAAEAAYRAIVENPRGKDYKTTDDSQVSDNTNKSNHLSIIYMDREEEECVKDQTPEHSIKRDKSDSESTEQSDNRNSGNSSDSKDGVYESYDFHDFVKQK